MGIELILPTFSAGELSEDLHARVDLQKYGAGLALCRNGFVHLTGIL